MESHNKKFNLIIFLLYLLPFFDMINGIMIEKYKIYGVGSSFHLFLLLILFLRAYLKSKINIGKLEKYTFLLILFFMISAILNSIIINNYQSISLERIEKIICTILSLSCICSFQKNGIITHQTLNKLLLFYCFLISIVSLFVNFIGLANQTYAITGLGHTGLFNGSNEPTVIFVLLNSYLVYKFSRCPKKLLIIPLLLNEINLVYVQQKSAYLFALIFGLLLFYLYFFKKSKKSKVDIKKIMFGIPGIIITMLFAKNIIVNNITKFISRQDYIKKQYVSKSYFNYLFSGRLERMRNLISPIFNENIFALIFHFLFGQGLNFNYYETFEIDILDIFLYGGLFSAIIVILLFIYVFRCIWNTTKSKLAVFLMLMICFLSCTAGHILTGGISGTYFALICSYLMFDYNVKSKELL